MSATPSSPRRNAAGFSMAELVVSICVMLVLTALAVPSLLTSLRAYQLNQTAAGVSDMLKFTRFEAVRRNKQISLQVSQSGTGWIVWTDSFAVGNGGPIDPRDKQQLVAGFATLLPAGAPVPPPNAITTALGVGALTALSGANNSVTFDARGAIRLGIGGPVSNSVYVFYLGSNGGPDYGYRAVVLLPTGSTQTWTASSGGPWRQVS
jgi:type II secretory pathway pseudopilin PulG